jgi:uncharacterized protein YbjT (DUF2867 family)
MLSDRLLVTVEPASRLPGAVPTAPVARCLAAQWLDAGGRVRVLGPASEGTGWPEGVEYIAGSIHAPDESAQAFEGIDVVCLAGLAGERPRALREATNRIVQSACRSIAVLSSHGAAFETEHSSETWEWLACERALEMKRISCVFVRPTGLFANAICGGYPISGSDWAGQVAREAVIRERSPDAPYPFVHEDDVAGVLAAVLTVDTAQPRGIDISGPMISARERAEILSRVLGRRVVVEPFASDAEAREAWLRRGWPAITIDVTLFAENHIQRHFGAVSAAIAQQVETTQRLLGRRLRTFADWAAAHAHCFGANRQPPATP